MPANPADAAVEKPLYLVVGGAGFVGRVIIEQLLARGDRVAVLDMRRTGPLADDPRLAAFHVADLTAGDGDNGGALATALRGVHAVVHAASPHPGAPAAIMRAVNVDGTRRLVAACRAAGVRKLVFTSSASVVYDGSDLIAADETMPFPAVHMDVYNETKAEAEAIVLKAAGDDLLTAAIRPSAIFGPGDPQGGTGLIKTGRSGRTAFYIGTNAALFDWTHVENVAHGHILALDKLTPDSGVSGQAFFITNDNPIFFWAIPKLLWFHLGLTSTLHYSLPLGLALSLAWLAELYVLAVRLLLGRQLDITFTVFRIRVFGKNRYYDISKAKRLLGYKPILTLEQGIKQLAVWYLERDPKPWK